MEKKDNNNLYINNDNNNKNKKKGIKKRNYKQIYYQNQNTNIIIKDDSNSIIFNEDPLFNLIFKKKAKKSYGDTFSISDKSIETQMTQSDEEQNKCKKENNSENNF